MGNQQLSFFVLQRPCKLNYSVVNMHMKLSLVGGISANFLENSCPSEAEKNLCIETAVITSNEF